MNRIFRIWEQRKDPNIPEPGTNQTLGIWEQGTNQIYGIWDWGIHQIFGIEEKGTNQTFGSWEPGTIQTLGIWEQGMNRTSRIWEERTNQTFGILGAGNETSGSECGFAFVLFPLFSLSLIPKSFPSTPGSQPGRPSQKDKARMSPGVFNLPNASQN